ncbi:MAG: TVP38/TMEM64 family protein [Leptolyngbyaceae cyanobacterium CSU_1_4]|nr:TVP38/TMEM64 family protein [Leptolyngbyaceae cyanobacterium CSU_1_4]
MRRLKKLRVLLTAQNAIALLLLGVCLISAQRFLSVDILNPSQLLRSIQDLGLLGKLIYAGILVLAVVVSPIPGTPLTVAAGAVWSPWTAGIYGTLGVFVGSLLAYFLGRTLGRSLIQVLSGKTIHISKHRGETYIGWLLFFSHLLPIVPFDLISYGAGMIRLSLPLYATATLLGTLPGTFLLAYLGASFTLSPRVGIAIAVFFALLLIGVPWTIHRCNWFGIRDVIRIE